MRFFERGSNHHALARSQAICLDHDRRTLLIQVGVRRCRIAEGGVGCGGNAMARHEGLGIILGAFKLGGLFCRAKNLQAGAAKRIHDPFGQRRFRSNHGEGNFFALGKSHQFRHSSDRYIIQIRFQRCTGIAGGNKHLVNSRRLRQLPGQRMLATTAANNQNFHFLALS